MDLNSYYIQGGISASLIAALGIIYKTYKAIDGKKIHSKCCDKDIEFGMRVEEMTPPREHPPTVIVPQQEKPQHEYKVNPMNISREKDG